MSDRRIVYTAADGQLVIVIPAPAFMANFKSEAVGLAAIRAKDVPKDATDVAECAASDIPADRTFRDALERDTTASPAPVRHNRARAEAIHMARIRAARDRKLLALDGEWMRAHGQGQTAAAADVESARQILRDIPQTLDLSAARTLDDLKALWPAEIAE